MIKIWGLNFNVKYSTVAEKKGFEHLKALTTIILKKY